ncbi:hypothetical protein TrRE_jg13058 [Triparma retinervis]|uniref:Fe-S metabolism associated domain-containing protein n=1 Tax=Triparma retinervis TaxID=2557542 RepID=A0A9W6ZM43_9STRA|nr:hypothetical protein TrRE_jg13058 [Triparma retinervis]
MPPSLKVDSNKVPGCLSTVHVHADYDGASGTLSYKGDSDGLLTKGLVAMLVDGLSGCTPEEVRGVDPGFISRSGIEQSLTPGRNNGFLNMIQVMKDKATDASEGSGGGGLGGGEEEEDKQEGGPIYNEMITKLQLLQPTSLTLLDDSASHASHAGSSGFSGESHFKLSIVAPAFSGLNALKRHRLVYTILGDVMDRIHALEIEAKDPTQA